jgi:hypothetical protein
MTSPSPAVCLIPGATYFDWPFCRDNALSNTMKRFFEMGRPKRRGAKEEMRKIWKNLRPLASSDSSPGNTIS